MASYRTRVRIQSYFLPSPRQLYALIGKEELIYIVAEWLERALAVREVSGSIPSRVGHKNL